MSLWLIRQDADSPDNDKVPLLQDISTSSSPTPQSQTNVAGDTLNSIPFPSPMATGSMSYMPQSVLGGGDDTFGKLVSVDNATSNKIVLYGETESPYAQVNLPNNTFMLGIPMSEYDEEKDMDKRSISLLETIEQRRSEPNFFRSPFGRFYQEAAPIRNFLIRVENTRNVFILMSILDMTYMLMAFFYLEKARLAIIIVLLYESSSWKKYEIDECRRVVERVSSWYVHVSMLSWPVLVLLLFVQALLIRLMVALFALQLNQRLQELTRIQSALRADLWRALAIRSWSDAMAVRTIENIPGTTGRPVRVQGRPGYVRTTLHAGDGDDITPMPRPVPRYRDEELGIVQ